jgi:hypothetical protein
MSMEMKHSSCNIFADNAGERTKAHRCLDSKVRLGPLSELLQLPPFNEEAQDHEL